MCNFRNSKSLLDSSSDSTSTSDLQRMGSEIRTRQNKKYTEKGSNKTGTAKHGDSELIMNSCLQQSQFPRLG